LITILITTVFSQRRATSKFSVSCSGPAAFARRGARGSGSLAGR
jgi:hypothetical protein